MSSSDDLAMDQAIGELRLAAATLMRSGTLGLPPTGLAGRDRIEQALVDLADAVRASLCGNPDPMTPDTRPGEEWPEPSRCDCRGKGSLYLGEHRYGCPMFAARPTVSPGDDLAALLTELDAALAAAPEADYQRLRAARAALRAAPDDGDRLREAGLAAVPGGLRARQARRVGGRGGGADRGREGHARAGGAGSCSPRRSRPCGSTCCATPCSQS